jgi:hypothetical protein
MAKPKLELDQIRQMGASLMQRTPANLYIQSCGIVSKLCVPVIRFAALFRLRRAADGGSSAYQSYGET